MSYTGSIDEADVSALATAFGELVEGNGELGFILTYHAAEGDGVGVMDLRGRGITQDLLVQLFADALARNATHGYTA